MAGAFRAAVDKAIPWLLFGSVLLPAFGSAVAGILVLVFWRQAGDIALGILVIFMGLAVMAGTFISLGLLRRQNRMARNQAEFIAHVSHELRTPMASILMGIETLRDNRFETENERRQFLDMLDIESRRLSTLVEQAIGYQIAAGHGKKVAAELKSKPDTGCASNMVSKALTAFVTGPDTRDCVIVTRAHMPADRCDDMIQVDPPAFAGAVCNLVNNALTHGMADDSNPVTVTVRVRENGCVLADVLAPYGEIEIEVKDRGPGLKKTEMDLVFKKFSRGKDAADNGIPGLGLGLSIVREFAAASGGLVTVDSSPGNGAAFRLILPRHQEKTDA